MDTKEYKVTLTLMEDLLGTIPKNREVYKTYIASKAADLGLAEEEVATVPQLEEKGWTGFHEDKDGKPFLYNYTIKGFLCEAARTVKFGALKQLQDKFKRHVFVSPRKIHIGEIDGCLERPLRAMTAQGPRVTLVRSDVIPAGREINFKLTVIQGIGITENCLREVFAYGRFIGLGQWRSGGYGNFELTTLDEI